MNNKEVAHKWAHQAGGRASGSSFYFAGDTIYSYGGHFPIARLFTHPKTKEQCVLFTTHGYSSSTSRHKSLTLSACSHLRIFYVDNVANQKTDGRAVKSLERAEEKRRAENEKAEQAANVKREAKALKLLAKSPEIVAEWLAGTRHSLPGGLNLPVMLRRIGDDMETSKGARVPLADAERTFKFCQLSRSRGWHRNGETHAVGSYQLDAVNEAGVVAGCHRVMWAEIERFAISQGWLTAPVVEDAATYTTFLRSARNFEEMASAEKITQAEGLTLAEARDACAEFNNNRSGAEIEAGTKMEFTRE